MSTLLTSMELTADEAKEEVKPYDDPPKYPWGLCIDLNSDALKKLGISNLPDVGTPMMITAKAEVSTTSTNQYQDGEKHMCLSLQITDMAVGPVARDSAAELYK